MAKRIPSVRAVSTNFEYVAKASDDEVIEMVIALLRYSPKPVFPKVLRYNSYRVSRDAGGVTVHFLWTENPQHLSPEEVGRYRFEPPPFFV